MSASATTAISSPATVPTSAPVIDIGTGEEYRESELPHRQRFRPSPERPKCFIKTSIGHCTNQTHWRVDGHAYCKRHFDEFWESHFVEDHRVSRLDQGDGY